MLSKAVVSRVRSTRNLAPSTPQARQRDYKPAAKQPFNGQRASIHVEHGPGHVQLRTNPSETNELRENLGADTAPPGGWQSEATVGHFAAPDSTSTRYVALMEGEDLTHLNPQRTAAHPMATHPAPMTSRFDLGEMKSAQARVLAEHIENAPEQHSAHGKSPGPLDKVNWTKGEIRDFLLHGKVPMSAPDSVDFLGNIALGWARLECADEGVIAQFQKELSQATTPQDLAPILAKRFRPDAAGFMTFDPPAVRNWRADRPTEPARMQNTALFETCRNAFRANTPERTKVFLQICADMENKGGFLLKAMNEPKNEYWFVAAFAKAGEQLHKLGPNEALGLVCYHRDMYEGNIVHVSLMSIKGNGSTLFCNHESVPLVARHKKAVVENLMPKTLGLPTNTWDTTELFEHWEKAGIATWYKDKLLPPERSYNDTGMPIVMFTRLGDFDTLQKWVDEGHERSLELASRQWNYCADPNTGVDNLIRGVRAGALDVDAVLAPIGGPDDAIPSQKDVEAIFGPRFLQEPSIVSPGFTDGIAYTNNCSWHTLQALRFGKATHLGSRAPDSRQALSDVFRMMRDSGLQPWTDPALGDRMDEAGFVFKAGNVERSTASFLIGGGINGLTSAVGGHRAPDIPGRDLLAPTLETPDVAKGQAAAAQRKVLRQEKAEAADRSLGKNRATFEEAKKTFEPTPAKPTGE
ncbi:MAG: hypothetical protein V4787_06280 [Pseudomonadota bacterium]